MSDSLIIDGLLKDSAVVESPDYARAPGCSTDGP